MMAETENATRQLLDNTSEKSYLHQSIEVGEPSNVSCVFVALSKLQCVVVRNGNLRAKFH